MRNNIIRLLSATLSVLVAAGSLVLLIAAINKKNNKTCSGFNIQVNGGGGRIFIDQKEVFDLLTGNGTDKLVGKTIASLDLRKKEEMIRKNIWIRDAEVFFDNNEVMRIKVIEREPVARIFTWEGESSYIDSSGVLLPLTNKLPARVPVFTGFPRRKPGLHGTDTALIRQIIGLSAYILNDPFWMAQIEQININPDKTFEMVPALGSHLIGFGDGNDVEQKFHNLLIFYRKVMTKTGFEKYGKIDLRYAGQIVATKRGANIARIDSLKAVRNIEQLIRSAQQVQVDDFHQQNSLPLEHNSLTERTLTNYDLIPNADEKLSDTPSGARDPQHKSIKKRINNKK